MTVMAEADHIKWTMWLTVGILILTGLGVAVALDLPPFNKDKPVSGDPPGIPASLVGTWHGDVDFPGTGPVPFDLNLGSGSPGADVGTVDINDDCDEQLYLNHGGDQVELRVKLSSGAHGLCGLFSDLGLDFSVYIDVSLSGDDSLQVGVSPAPGQQTIGSGSLDRAS